ncbi:MAG: ATP-binding protein [Promethearchaeota archaeon]
MKEFKNLIKETRDYLNNWIEQLFEFSEYYENIVETIMDPLIVLDKNLRIISANKAFYKSFLLKPKEIEKKLIYELENYQWNIPELKNLLEEIIPKNTKIENYEIKFSFKRLGERILLVNARRIYSEKGKTKLILLALDDITDRRKAEQLLIDSEEKYRTAYIRLDFYKDLFTHDINNILQGIYSGLELSEMYLEDQEKKHKLKELIQIVKDHVFRGTSLVENVKKMTELEETEQPLKKVEIIDLIKKNLDYFKKTYSHKKINISTDFHDTKINVQANELIGNVFENIFSNAVRHNIQEIIEIGVKSHKIIKNSIPYIRIEISDNGVGIIDERKESIFQRVFNEDRSVKGMGLGLSLVKKIMNIYNGNVWVEDKIKGRPEKGSVFKLEFLEA